MNQLCHRLRLLRMENCFTQHNIAEFLGITQQMYSRYETGATEIPYRRLARLADLYRTSVDYLLGRSDMPRRKRNISPGQAPLTR